ncbi:TPA: type IV secretion system protein [Aeromonas veronii]
MRKKILSAILMFSLNGSVVASGIPVFDGAAAANFLQQIKQLRDQYEQMRVTANSLKGVNNIGDLLRNPQIRYYMPADLQGAYDEMARTVYKGESGSYQGLDGVLGAMEDAKRNRDSWEKMSKEREQRAVLDVASIDASYRGAMARLDGLEQMMGQVGKTPTAKESADLNARINAEMALLQSESNRINLMVAMQDAQQRQLESEQKALMKKSLKTTGTSIPRF